MNEETLNTNDISPEDQSSNEEENEEILNPKTDKKDEKDKKNGDNEWGTDIDEEDDF